MTITPSQCRAARALLDWSQQKLAEESRIGNATIRNFEGGKSEPQHATLDVLRRTLETAGVIFLADGETTTGGPGVRLMSGELPNASSKHPAEGNDNDEAGEADERREAND